ncbi:MAG: helix-turn-helix transcriptional regulator [Bacteroidetes bacterium]|nr:helix-turn-helix transcriptional regulator [Bacteroidota bacterium]
MEIHHLPRDIFQNSPAAPDEIIIHHYKASAQTFRGKCILHSNAISLVISGTKSMHFADTSVHINSNEIHFLSAGNCMVTMELAKGITVESILIFFDNKTLADFHHRYKTQPRPNAPQPFLNFKKDSFITNYIDSLHFLLQSGTPLSSEMRRLKFEEIMLYLLERYPSQILSFPLSKNKDLEDIEIRKAVESNILTGISLDDLAFLCNLSTPTFKRRFQSIYGISPRKWFLQKKMELAKELILKDGERPGDIYHKLGYENHSSFSQSFKQHFGVSPSELKAPTPATLS